MELHIFPYGMIVMDGKRVIAKARYIVNGGQWLIKSYGFEWLDPAAHKPNRLGTVDRRFIVVPTKAKAKKALSQLVTAPN